MDSNKQLSAFVIGPIGDRHAEEGSKEKSIYENSIEVLEYVIQPACAALDIKALRADQITKAGEINEQIFRYLRDAPIVIADLTGANPNVMYELGLRHTTGKLTFQIGEKERLPFDVTTIRTILFKRSEAGLVSAKRSLIAAIAEGLEHGTDPVSSTRVWLEVPGAEIPTHSKPADLEGEDEDEPGFLERLADMELGLADIAQTSERSFSILEEITQVVRNGTDKINAIPAAQNYSSLKLAAVNKVASELNDPAVRLSIVSQEFHRNVDRIVPGIEYLLAEAANNPEQIKDAPNFLISVYTLVAVSEEAANNAAAFADSLEHSANATRLMKRVTSSIRKSTLSMVSTFRRVAAWKPLADRVNRQNPAETSP